METALVAEDGIQFSLQVADLLANEGRTVIDATSAAQTLKRLDALASLLVTDVRMPGAMGGLSLAREVSHRWPDVAVVVVPAQVDLAQVDLGRGDLPDGVPFVGCSYIKTSIRSAVRAPVALKTSGA